MKKHIYKISLLVLTIFAFVGCNVDNDDPVVNDIIRNIEASMAMQGDIIAINDDASSYDLVINFSDALPSYGTIEYTVDGVAGSVSANTGDTSVSIPLEYGMGVNFHDVALVGFYVVNADARNVRPSIGGTTSTRVVKQGYLKVEITWADASDDIDFGLQPMTAVWGDTFAWIDTSLGVTNLEVLEGDMLADGNYAILAQFFTPATDVMVNYSLQTAGGDFSFDLLTAEDGNVLWFTKSSSGTTVSYTFYTEDPA